MTSVRLFLLAVLIALSLSSIVDKVQCGNRKLLAQTFPGVVEIPALQFPPFPPVTEWPEYRLPPFFFTPPASTTTTATKP